MATGDSEPLWGQTKVSAAEAKEHEDLLKAKRMVEVPSNLLMKVDYDTRTDANPVYVGYAPRGSADEDDGWLLQKLTYDTTDRVTIRQVAYGNWTDRTSESYG